MTALKQQKWVAGLQHSLLSSSFQEIQDATWLLQLKEKEFGNLDKGLKRGKFNNNVSCYN